MTRFGVVVAARFSSSRLPGKAMLPFGGTPMLEFLFHRLTPLAPDVPVYFATSNRDDDDQLAALAVKAGIPCFRGDRDDVVARFVGAAEHFGIEYPIRVTGDCPFLDSATIKHCLSQLDAKDETGRGAGQQFDIATTKGIFPVGIDIEIYSQAVMKRLHVSGNLTPEEREHLTLRFYKEGEGITIRRLGPPVDWPSVASLGGAKFTVDTPADYEFACELLQKVPGNNASTRDYLEACRS